VQALNAPIAAILDQKGCPRAVGADKGPTLGFGFEGDGLSGGAVAGAGLAIDGGIAAGGAGVGAVAQEKGVAGGQLGDGILESLPGAAAVPALPSEPLGAM
jgi:hypothetical protein